MNTLNRTIQPGEIVIVAKDQVIDGLKDRRFKCEGGSGMHAFTVGSAIYGHWMIDGEEARIEGNWIDAAETAAQTRPQTRHQETT